MRKRIGAYLLVVCMFLLSACGSSSTYFPIDSHISETGEHNEMITLHYTSFLLDTAQSGHVYYDAVSEFEARNPHIKVKTDFIQNAHYTAGVKTRLLGGEKIDVFDTWSPSLFEEFRALNEQVYLDLTGSAFLEDFLPSSLEPVTVDGSIYGVPEVMHSDGFIYNKTMFERLGLAVPRNWEEFIHICDILQANDVIPIAMDSEWWVAQFFWGSMMTNYGADKEWTKKLERGEIQIDHPYFVHSINKLKFLIDQHYVPEYWTSIKHEQAKDLMGRGEAAMIMTGTWDMRSIMERNPDIEFDFMMVPGEEQTVPNINIGSFRVIHAGTEHPEAAKAFVAFMNGKENQEKLALGTMAVPSVLGAEIDHPVVNSIADTIRSSDAEIYWPHTVSTESLQVKIQESVNQFLLGQELDRTLAEIQQAIDQNRENGY